MKNQYYYWMSLIVLLLVWLGWVGPYCISSESDELVIGYIALSLIMAPLVLIKPLKTLLGGCMKLFKLLSSMYLILFIFMAGCSKVPAGNVGIKFYLLGQKKGVDYDELKPGRYWIGFNEELYLFPTFTQNYVWTSDKQEGSPNDESFNFQDRQGLELNADVGITYHLDPDKVDLIFQKYKKGIDEITDVFLRNMVRDALVSRSSTLDVEFIYGQGRANLIDSVTKDVNASCNDIGIVVDKIYWIGRIKLPETVKQAIDSKIKATQIAQQRENELREAEAQAKKVAAEAEGKAEAILKVAGAEAKANDMLNRSLTANLVNYRAIEKWDGKLPQVSGSNTPFISIGK